uniref:Uncharacterized protein n=1 Tax=Rhizoctonia cerealis hypovirus TaxID=3068667 RepID=A0AA51BS84_9VIRU|nr:MAG: hypothetical protein [Rhizoctonia cerealis hypovirus]
MSGNTSGNRSYIPVWGGLGAFIGSPWSLYTHTFAGVRNTLWFYRMFNHDPDARAPLRQRLLTTGISTANVPLSELDPNQDEPLLDWDQSTPEQMPMPESKNVPSMTWEIVMSPFSLVFRAILLPVVGAVDIAIKRSLPIVYTMVSLVYQSLPMSSITRISRFIRIVKRGPEFRAAPAGFTGVMTSCYDCDSSYNTMKRRAIPSINQTFSVRCEHALSFAWSAFSSRHPEFDLYTDTLDDPAWIPSYTFRPMNVCHNWNIRLREIFGISSRNNCSHPIIDHTRMPVKASIPSPTVDSLYTFTSDTIWRCNDRAFGVRCTKCFTQTLHSWDPDIIHAFRNFSLKAAMDNMTQAELVDLHQFRDCVAKIIRWQRLTLKPSQTYYLQSCSNDRLGYFESRSYEANHIVLVDCLQTLNSLVERFPHLALKDNYIVLVPLVHGPISMAGWRLLFASICPIDCGFLIYNQTTSYYEPLMLSVLSKLKIPWSSGAIAHTFPMYMGSAYITGCSSQLTSFEWLTMFWLGSHCYGWDEIIPAIWEKLTTVIMTDPGLPEIMAPLVPNELRKYSVSLFYLIDSAMRCLGSYSADFTRENILIMKRLSRAFVDTGQLTTLHAIADPRPISAVSVVPDLVIKQWDEITADDPRFNKTTAPGENILAELTHSMGGITWFVFGSRGDFNPILANCRYLASIGAKITIIKLNTEAEGRILANTDSEHERIRLQLFLRAREYLADFSGMAYLAPHQLLNFTSTTYSLAPPIGMIHGFVASSNVLVSIAYQLLGLLSTPDINIGAFPMARCLPTSHDGEHFMEHRLNVSKPGVIKAWWGGDNKPVPGWEHIPVVEAGDHQEIFPTIETLVTKGTVGTNALASLCGCKVVVADDGGFLDHAYTNPYDAGQGFIGGQDPDRALLALAEVAPQYFGIWFRANWYNIRELWAWYGPASTAMLLFRLLMGYLFLSRVHKTTMISSNPVTTLLLMLDGRSTVPMLTYVKYLIYAKVFDTVLVVVNKNYYWLAQKFLTINSRLFSSTIALWCAQRYGWAMGMLASWLLTFVDEAMTWLVSWIPITLGAPVVEVIKPQDEFIVIEFVLVYRVVPVLHVAFVAPSNHIRIEGALNDFGLYTAHSHHGTFHSPFVFPTRILLSDVLDRLKYARALPYGPTWHCYTVLWDLMRGQTTRFGVSAIPFLIVQVISSTLSITTSAILATFYTMAVTIPAMGGATTRGSGLLSMVATTIRDTMTMIESARGDYVSVINIWFSRLTFLTPIPEWLHH